MTTTKDALVDRLRADVEHLRDLLDLLPTDDGFWARMSEAEHPEGSDGDYFHRKLSGVVSQVQGMADCTAPITVSKLENAAQYILMFFDRNDPAMHRVLEPVANFSNEPGRTGRRWSEDLCATAWRLYVPCRAVRNR